MIMEEMEVRLGGTLEYIVSMKGELSESETRGLEEDMITLFEQTHRRL